MFGESPYFVTVNACIIGHIGTESAVTSLVQCENTTRVVVVAVAAAAAADYKVQQEGSSCRTL